MTTEERREPLAWLVLAPGLLLSMVAWAAVIGLGVARRGDAVSVALSASMLVFGPALALGAASPERRLTRSGLMLCAWSTGLLLALPVYFPGERRDAVATGLSLLAGDHDGEGVGRSLADRLPDEPVLAVAQVPQARVAEEEQLPPGAPIGQDEIALPYEGEGRRLSVPVVFEHAAHTVSVDMMLDTGATYTTLPLDVLARLGIFPSEDAPELTLHTANGQRKAQVVLLDRVWLGDLPLDGVAVTTCEDCASEENAGLLGLNVTGAYNLNIDADRREVIFSRRARFNRRLDVRPFTHLEARFVRFPGGHVEVELDMDNRALRPVHDASAKITCDSKVWMVDLGPVGARASTQVRQRLPRHPRCEAYQIVLDEAWW